MRQRSRSLATLALAGALTVGLTGYAITPVAAADEPTSSENLRPVEYLTRGLVAAQTGDGIFLSWRFLGDEPDGLSWNVYRKDGKASWKKIATVDPRDVQPESDYAENPGVVKENSTPSNYTDPDGQLTSIYEVAPVVDGEEGMRQGMDAPMLSALPGAAGQENRGAVHYVPLKPAPAPVPLAQFTYRGQKFGGSQGITAANMVIPDTGGQHWYQVDMELLKSFRVPFEQQTTVTQTDLDGWLAALNAKNVTPNAMGVATYTTPYVLENGLVDGKVTEALFKELEGEFIKYLKNLDSGESLPYALTAEGAVSTTMSGNYNTHDMTVGDFDGDGVYEIVVKWRAGSPDPMYSEPIFGGNNTTSAPEYIDVYKQDGTLLFRVDMGYNIRSANDHETTLFAEDFDGDGKSELMLKTGLGTRVGNWDEASGSVVYSDSGVVGGADGLASTTPKFQEYFATGNTEALDTYWALLNSFTISYRSPTVGGGNDGPNDMNLKRWIKTYHVGPIGPAKNDQEFFSAFEWDAEAGAGVLIDSELYPHPYRGSVDGDNWAMSPTTQRGNFAYLAFPGPGAGTSSSDYKAQVMHPSQAYWLTNPWKAASFGDAQGNRANRYVGVVAALDGVNQYAVSQRGYYQRTTLAAFNLVNREVNLQATFDSADPQFHTLGGTAYDYQNRGNHDTKSADLDGDGWDEVVLKAMVLGLNEDKTKILPKVLNGDVMATIDGLNGVPPVANQFEFGTEEIRNNPLNEWAPFRHGDRGALLPVDKTNHIAAWSGMEEHLYDDQRTGIHHGWMPGPMGYEPMEGRKLDENGEIVETNSLIYGVYAGSDAEGAVAGNFSNRWPGAQGHSGNGARSMLTGDLLNGSSNLGSGNNAIWFGGGLTHMAVNGANILSVNDLTFATTGYLNTGLTSTGNKSTPTLKADMFGDWREEIILRGSNNRLGIVTTLAPTEYGIRTLMHDPMYRMGVANKNNGYDQLGFASFYLGDEAELPGQRDDILVPQAPYDLNVTAEATVRCVAGKGQVVLRVSNDDIAPVELEVTSSFGAKSVEELRAGKKVSMTFATRQSEVAAGTVTVDVSAVVYGNPQSETLTVAYDGRSCR